MLVFHVSSFSSRCCVVVKTNLTLAGTNQCQLNLDLVCCILSETDEVQVNVSRFFIAKQHKISYVSACFLFLSCYNFAKRDIKHFLMCWSCFDGSIQTSVFFTKCMIIGTLLCRLIFLLLRFLFL